MHTTRQGGDAGRSHGGGLRRIDVVHTLAGLGVTISLVLVFYVVITPIGVIRSALGRSPMERGRGADTPTYRTTRQPRHVSHLLKRY